MKIYITKPYSCKGRVMTSEELSVWREGNEVQSTEATFATVNYTPRRIEGCTDISIQLRKSMAELG